MSSLITSFDPTNASLLDGRGIGIIKTNGINQNEQLVLYNSSLVCFQLTFKDETTDIMPPSWAKSFKKGGPISNIQYTPLFTLPAQAGAQPVSLCYGSVYEAGEQVADLNAPLQYVYNIGNSVNTNVNSSTLVNTGNPPLTPNVVNIQPSDVTSGHTLNVDNSGNFSDYSDNGGVLTSLLQLIAGASPKVLIAASNILTNVLGTLQVDNYAAIQSGLNPNVGLLIETGGDTQQGLIIFPHTATQSADLFRVENSVFTKMFAVGANGSITADTGKITTDGSGDMTVESLTSLGNILLPNTGRAQWQDTSNNPNLWIDSGPDNVMHFHNNDNNGFQFFDSSGLRAGFKSMSSGQASGINGVVVTHGLGGTPALVLIVPIVAQPGSATAGVGNVGATTFEATCGAGSGFYWFAMR